MEFIKHFKNKIHSCTESDFDDLALELFCFQAVNNPVYAKYISYLGISPEHIKKVEDIPFLPIQFFKNYKVLSSDAPVQEVFESSGTTGQAPSRHFVPDPEFYNSNTRSCFRGLYGDDPANFAWLALLPSYLERSNASLVYMADHFIGLSHYPESGFYLNEFDRLAACLKDLKQRHVPVVLIGVSFALLDLAEQFPMDLSGVTIMETGGMKGRREEITRPEFHKRLKEAFGVNVIHSEYGMTELMSQAYAFADGLYWSPPWMKVFMREINDPLSVSRTLRGGALNIIDLANVDSCAFIETEDLGKVYHDGSFEVLGRLDQSEMRGCNIMVM